MIVSFDVGIKNLSFCTFTHNEDENENENGDEAEKYTLSQWDIINLCGDKLSCKYNTKNGICGKTATYKCLGVTVCGTHKKQFQLTDAPSTFYKYIAHKRISKRNIETFAQDIGLQLPLDFEYVNQHVNNNFATKIQRSPSANDMDLIAISKKLAILIPQYINISDTKILLIENQISPLAGRIKVIQGMITQVFVDINQDIAVHYVSSANKLKNFNVPKKTYSDRKKSGIALVHELMQKPQYSNWKTTFAHHKKKDDLADSLLQALWYISTQVKVTS